MFKRIGYTIALQFSAFVFLFLVVNGIIFLAADFNNVRHQAEFRLERMEQMVAGADHPVGSMSPPGLPPMAQDRVRLLDASGVVLYSGGFFTDVPFSHEERFAELTIDNDEFTVLTDPIQRGGVLVGYVQVADVSHQQRGDLIERALLYLLVCSIISALTFFVGLFFARRSLHPAEQMMERLEQFTQDASHELRTPLAALSSSLDLALRNKQYREGILSAKDDLKRVASLVERLLELARLDKFALGNQSVDLAALAAETIASHRILAEEKQVRIESDLAVEVRAVGDALLIRQAMGNLLTNAIKFSKGRTAVVRIRLTKDVFTVEDNGVGIKKESLPNIFNRFYQADASRAKGGFGLGLALVKRIVELHGWTVTVQSVEGKGTTFTIHFRKPSKHAKRS